MTLPPGKESPLVPLWLLPTFPWSHPPDYATFYQASNLSLQEHLPARCSRWRAFLQHHQLFIQPGSPHDLQGSHFQFSFSKSGSKASLVLGLSHLLYGVTLSELRAKYWCDGCLGQVSDLPELANFLRDFLHLKNSQLVDSQLADQQVVVLSPAVLYLYLYLLHFCLCGGFYTCFSAASHISIAYPPQALQPVNFNSQT